MKKLFSGAIALIIVAAGVFNSCKKENVEKSAAQTQDKMRTFTSVEELFKEIEKVNPMDVEELQEYERTIGFQSFGGMSESIYYF